MPARNRSQVSCGIVEPPLAQPNAPPSAVPPKSDTLGQQGRLQAGGSFDRLGEAMAKHQVRDVWVPGEAGADAGDGGGAMEP